MAQDPLRDAVRTAIGNLPLQDASDLVDEGGICLAISGAKGAGKTTAAGIAGVHCAHVVKRAFNKQKPVLFLDIEGGMRAIRHLPGVQFIRVSSWKEYVKWVDTIAMMPEIPWGLIVTDNVTELAELNMQDILNRPQHKKEVPEWPEWRLNTQEMTVQVRKFRDMAWNRGIAVLFNVWDFAQTDESGNIRKIGLDMTPRLTGRFMGAVDMVAWLEVLDDDKGTRVMHLGGNNKVLAKVRKAPVGPEANMPLDLYWTDPADPASCPLVSILNTFLGGEVWDKTRHLAPVGLTAKSILRRREN